MQDLMLHLLDVAMNAVSAGAPTVRLGIHEAPEADLLRLYVADNGPGMAPAMVQRVLTEFATTKTKKAGWVAFGLALLRTTVDVCEGSFKLLSRPRVGTLVIADLPHSHPDRPPLGAVAESMQTLLVGCSSINFCFTHRVGSREYRVDTRPVRRAVGEAYATRTVQRWLTERLREGEAALADRSEVS